MNRYHNLQMKMPAENVAPGMELFFKKDRYTLGQPVPKTLQPAELPIGVITGGYTEQFALLRDNEPVGAAWFYFYHAFESKDWAVLDEVELTSVPSVCA